jgi:hypothetical protein
VYEDDEQTDQTKPRMRGTDPAQAQAGGPMMRTMMGGGQQMPWHQQQQGQPDWGSILQRFQQRFQQHNPFAQRMGGAAPGGMPPGGAPQGGPPQGPPQGGNPWAERIAQAAARFGGNRQPGGIIPPGRGQY